MTIRRRFRKSTIRGELRNWREIHLTDTSYFAGNIYGDQMGQKRDGHSFVTGFLVLKIDRGDYFLVKTEGAYVYMLYKDREYKS